MTCVQVFGFRGSNLKSTMAYQLFSAKMIALFDRKLRETHGAKHSNKSRVCPRVLPPSGSYFLKIETSGFGGSSLLGMPKCQKTSKDCLAIKGCSASLERRFCFCFSVLKRASGSLLVIGKKSQMVGLT